MKDTVDEWLLAKVMGWASQEIVEKLPPLQALAAFKYDEYQQFSPGMRFIESLALWLQHFTDIERQKALEFILNRLVFISNSEMAHFISIAFKDCVRPFLFEKTAKQINVHGRFVARILKSDQYKVLTRQSLFLGLSDGARIDLFRRTNNQDLSHEQIWQTYDISEAKAKDLTEQLKGALSKIYNRTPTETEAKFQTLFLLDDFSGSGISYLRREGTAFEGKIHKIFDKVFDDSLYGLVDSKKVSFCILLYLATPQAKAHLETMTKEWLREKGNNNQCTILIVQPLPESLPLSGIKDAPIIRLAKEYFDDKIMTKHYLKGKIDNPHMGFDECALPLVLSHNTPNNSIPLLWYEEGMKLRGLFPRVSRHI